MAVEMRREPLLSRIFQADPTRQLRAKRFAYGEVVSKAGNRVTVNVKATLADGTAQNMEVPCASGFTPVVGQTVVILYANDSPQSGYATAVGTAAGAAPASGTHPLTSHTDWPAGLTAVELGYVHGVTSAIQTQLGLLAPKASPGFTGTLTIDADANLYRSAPDVLKTDDSLTVAGTLTAGTLAGIVKAAAGALSAIAIGTANQVLGVTSAGTGYEYKSILGTTSYIDVTHAANSVTLSLPTTLYLGAAATPGVLKGAHAPGSADWTNPSVTVQPSSANTRVIFAVKNLGGDTKFSVDYAGAMSVYGRVTLQDTANSSFFTQWASSKPNTTWYAGAPVYLKSVTSNDKVALAKADAAGTVNAFGLLTADSSDHTANIAHLGFINVGDWTNVVGSATLTVGATYYVSAAAAGALTTTLPTSTGQFIKAVGVAVTAYVMFLNPGGAPIQVPTYA
jgi:hypothetical protein